MDQDHKQKDRDYIRGVNLELIEKGREALEDMLEVAKASEHPRAYEVLFKGIRDIADIGDKLIDNEKKIKDIDKKETEGGKDKESVPVLAVTTDQLQRMLHAEERDVTPEPLEHEQ